MLRAKKLNGHVVGGNAHHNNSTDGALHSNHSKLNGVSNHQQNAMQIYNNYLQKLPVSKGSSHDKYIHSQQSASQQQTLSDANNLVNKIMNANNHSTTTPSLSLQNHNMSAQTQQYNAVQNGIPLQGINNFSNANNGQQSSNQNHIVFPNAYISHSPQPNHNLRSKKNNLMVYGFNGNQANNANNKSGHLQNGGNMNLQIGLHSMTNSNSNLTGENHQSNNIAHNLINGLQGQTAINGGSTVLNIKSQKTINGHHHINANGVTGNNIAMGGILTTQKEREKEQQMANIKKEKERISSLLNQNQGNLSKIVAPSSRNSKEDHQQSQTDSKGTGNINGVHRENNMKAGNQQPQQNSNAQQQQQQQVQLPPQNGASPYRYTSSFQVQPSNIHELNSFLNSNHYYNAAQDNERKKIGSNLGVGNLITRKNQQQLNGAQQNLDKSNEFLMNGPIQHGLVSASKAKDIKFQQAEEMKTIDIELRAANDSGGYVGLLTDPLDKHSKSVLSKNGHNPIQVIPSKGQAIKNVNKMLEQKRSFDFTSKRPNAAGGSRQSNDQDIIGDINQEVHDILNSVTQVNNSFTDKKPISSKWVLMNSKHVRNKSESKIQGQIVAKNFQNGSANSQLTQILAKDQNLKNGIYGTEEQKQYSQQFDPHKIENSVVSKYACKTRQGFIPNTKKTNQDAYIIQKEFAGIRGCWFLAVFDGHGMNGHLVSDFCKRTIPITLSNIINGGNGIDPILPISSAQGKKRKNKGSRHFLPPLVSQNSKKDQGGAHSFIANLHNGIYEDPTKQISDQIHTQNSLHDHRLEQKDPQEIQNWMTSNASLRDTQIKESFRITQEKLEYGTKIDCMFSGTTAVTVLIHQNTILCANSGDSRAIICSQNSAGIWSYTPLNRDHKPDEPDEAARVRKCNGRIEQSRLMPGQPGYGTGPAYQSSQPQFFGPKRVWLKHKQVPGLAMTRSMGDLVAKSVGVTYEPEIKAISNLTSQDKFIVIASDGLWDRIPNDEVCRIVANPFYERGDPEGAVQFLAKESADRWSREQGMIDDITIIIAFINPQQGIISTASHASNATGTNLTNNTTGTTNHRSESRTGQQI